MTARRHSRKRPSRRVAGVIGAITTALLAVGVYISYTANGGVPLESTYRIYADVPNADRLITTDEVRIGGLRIGQVGAVDAEPARAGEGPFARLELDLSPSAGPLPADTTVQVNSASVLGATYVQLTPGHSAHMVPAGGTLALSHTRRTVQLTDLLDIFNRSTAAGMRQTFAGLGAGLAGRGAGVNATIGSLRQFLPPFTAVAQTLAAPSTELARFVHGYATFVSALAPVSPQLSSFVAGGSTTFAAIGTARPALARTITDLPSAESAATAALTQLRPALDQAAGLATALRPAGRLLPSALANLDAAAAAGVQPVLDAPPFAVRLQRALRSLDRVSRIPSTDGAIRKLTDTLSALNTTLQVLGPAQINCDVVGAFGQVVSLATSLGSDIGPPLIMFGLSTLGASGATLQAAKPAPDLHVNYLPQENAQACAAGNEPFVPGTQDLSTPQGLTAHAALPTVPPPGVTALARKTGLLNAPAGTPQ